MGASFSLSFLHTTIHGPNAVRIPKQSTFPWLKHISSTTQDPCPKMWVGSSEPKVGSSQLTFGSGSLEWTVSGTGFMCISGFFLPSLANPFCYPSLDKDRPPMPYQKPHSSAIIPSIHLCKSITKSIIKTAHLQPKYHDIKKKLKLNRKLKWMGETI